MSVDYSFEKLGYKKKKIQQEEDSEKAPLA